MSNATSKLGINIMKATATGSKFNQHNSIKASYLILGNVALNQTNIKQKIQVFKPNTIDCKFITVLFTNNSGILYPPKKKIAVIQENKTIELYSAKKKKTNGTLECSVKNPATNSDSASCKSKGVREVSAKIDIK